MNWEFSWESFPILRSSWLRECFPRVSTQNLVQLWFKDGRFPPELQKYWQCHPCGTDFEDMKDSRVGELQSLSPVLQRAAKTRQCVSGLESIQGGLERLLSKAMNMKLKLQQTGSWRYQVHGVNVKKSCRGCLELEKGYVCCRQS